MGKNGKRGIINQKNEIIIPIEYDDISELGNKTLCVNNNDRYYIIDYQNKIINSDFSHIETLCLLSANKEPLFLALKNGKMGFIDQYGNIKIDFKYSPFGVNTLIFVKSKRLYLIRTLLLKPYNLSSK